MCCGCRSAGCGPDYCSLPASRSGLTAQVTISSRSAAQSSAAAPAGTKSIAATALLPSLRCRREFSALGHGSRPPRRLTTQHCHTIFFSTRCRVRSIVIKKVVPSACYTTTSYSSHSLCPECSALLERPAGDSLINRTFRSARRDGEKRPKWICAARHRPAAAQSGGLLPRWAGGRAPGQLRGGPGGGPGGGCLHRIPPPPPPRWPGFTRLSPMHRWWCGQQCGRRSAGSNDQGTAGRANLGSIPAQPGGGRDQAGGDVDVHRTYSINIGKKKKHCFWFIIVFYDFFILEIKDSSVQNIWCKALGKRTKSVDICCDSPVWA